MSGGSLNYLYSAVESAAVEIHKLARDSEDPEIDKKLFRKFAKHVAELSYVLRDVEWYFSYDIGAEEANRTIENFFKEMKK